MTSMRKIQTHQSIVWSHQSLIDLQVGRTSTQTLHIDAPLLRIEMECLQCSLLTCEFNGIDVLVSAVVSCSWVTLGVLVGHGCTEGIEDGTRGDIFGGDEEDGLSLALDLFFLRSM